VNASSAWLTASWFFSAEKGGPKPSSPEAEAADQGLERSKSLAKLDGRRSPERLQIDVKVCQFACRQTEKRKRAGRLEVHADHRRILDRVDDEDETVGS
jgi:hypothetical protein